jgi:hypothetical protein
MINTATLTRFLQQATSISHFANYWRLARLCMLFVRFPDYSSCQLSACLFKFWAALARSIRITEVAGDWRIQRLTVDEKG